MYTPSQLQELSSRIHQDIDAATRSELVEERRTHLGASEVGEDCLRQIWYRWRWIKAQVFDASMLRLFNRGHLEEPRFIRWLSAAGWKIQPINPQTGKQWVFAEHGGHYGGSTDGVAWHPVYFPQEYIILEFKTHNQKSFEKLVKEGVQKSKPKHYAQMSNYGAKFNCRYGLYVATNKNTDKIHPEVVALNSELASGLTERARYVITANQPPPRMASASPTFYKCKSCEMLGVCYYRELPDKNCRSCKFAVAADNAEWYCQGWRSNIPKDVIPVGCENYRSIV